jgi:hypothetical protein
MVLEVVYGRVVDGSVHEVDEVQPRGVKLVLVDLHIVAAGDLAEHEGQERVHYRARGGFEQTIDHRTVLLRGLQYHHRPVRSRPLEVEDQPRVLGPRIVLDEAPRPDADPFLGVGEQEDDVVLRGRTGIEGPQSLEEGDHARAAVARTRGGFRPGIVVGREQNGPLRIGGALQAHEDVVDPRCDGGTSLWEGFHGGGCLHPWFEPERPYLFQNVLAGLGVPLRTHRARLVGDGPEILHRPLGRELGGRGAGRYDFRRHKLVQSYCYRGGDRKKQRQGPRPAPPVVSKLAAVCVAVPGVLAS